MDAAMCSSKFRAPQSAGLLIPLLCLASAAYATSPKLASITPTGAQRGTEVELRLAGSRLDDTQELVFYEPGISVLKLDASKTNLVKVQIKIAPDCALGEHHLRIRTTGGVSANWVFVTTTAVATGNALYGGTLNNHEFKMVARSRDGDPASARAEITVG